MKTGLFPVVCAKGMLALCASGTAQIRHELSQIKLPDD